MSIPRAALFSLVLVALLAPAAGSQKINSISPSIAHPGEKATLTGGPFPEGIEILIGNHAVSPFSRSTDRLVLIVPSLSEGDYVVGLLASGEQIPSSLTLTITLPAPQITELSPHSVDSCSKSGGVMASVSGSDFVPGSRIQIDGSAVPTQRDNGTLLFAVPAALEGGLHEITVVTPQGKQSLPVALQVDTTPEIFSVSEGSDLVNSYEVIIHGRNFLYSSTLVVDGRAINNLPQQMLRPPQSDHVRYLNCQTMVYQRYPYSREVRDVSLQVINPDGQQSAVTTVAIP